MARKLREFSGKKLSWGTAEFKHNTSTKNKNCLVLVPVYKAAPTNNELASFFRVASVLGQKYEIALLHGKSLNIANYNISGLELSEVICDDIFFSSRGCYSDMMEFPEFYELFSDYEFILLYQLDAWIFEDRIDYFTKLNYDFIGSVHVYSGGNGFCVGNGGFSLRKISSFIKVCKETTDAVIPQKYPEDLAFSVVLSKKLKIAPMEIGLQFGFQNTPEKLYVKNGNKLPMGCHAYEKCNFAWWKKFINISDTLKYRIYSKDAALFKKAETWTIGHGANLSNPQTISDKLGWLKIYDCSPLKTLCADKIRIREYCKKKLGKDICVPILKVYNKPEEINFDELPDKFVLKCNHGSGYNIIVKDKAKENLAADKSKLKGWLSKDFALNYFYEMHYHYIDKKCYAEKMLGNNIIDYKFWCFNGEPKFFTMGAGGGHGAINHYDMNGKYLPELSRIDYPSDPSKKYDVPETFNEMVSYAKKLSGDFKFVRVDFYYVDEQIYLGELTFVPGAGSVKYKDSKSNIAVGRMLSLAQQSSKQKKRGVVYTCITGDYESLSPLSTRNADFDYVCYTDKELESDFWEVRQIPENLKALDNKRINRYIKVHPHEFFPKYDLSIYIDGNVDIRKDLNSFIDENCPREKGVIFAGQHPNRTCIYKEAEAVIRLRKDVANNVTPQIQKYTKEGFPKNYGLTQNCIMIRYHNDEKCKRLMDTWWKEILNESYRDQLSLFYALWKNPDVKYGVLNKSIFAGPVFVWEKTHKKNRTKTTIITSPKRAATDTVLPIKSTSALMGSSTTIASAVAPRAKYKPMIKVGTRTPRTKSMKKVLSVF